jgi:hypothetical protein
MLRERIMKVAGIITGSDKTRVRKEQGKPTLRSVLGGNNDYITDWHGSIRRNFEKSPSKKIRARAKRMAKRKALADQIPF